MTRLLHSRIGVGLILPLYNVVVKKVIGRAKDSPPEASEIQEASELLKVIGDLTRMRILCALLPGEDLSVGELQRTLGMSQSAISHQLRVLRDANLVKFRRAGKMVYYSLADGHVYELLTGTLEHVRHD